MGALVGHFLRIPELGDAMIARRNCNYVCTISIASALLCLVMPLALAGDRTNPHDMIIIGDVVSQTEVNVTLPTIVTSTPAGQLDASELLEMVPLPPVREKITREVAPRKSVMTLPPVETLFEFQNPARGSTQTPRRTVDGSRAAQHSAPSCGSILCSQYPLVGVGF